MMKSSIIGASTMLNVLIQHLPLQSLFWSKTWRACGALGPRRELRKHLGNSRDEKETQEMRSKHSSIGFSTC